MAILGITYYNYQVAYLTEPVPQTLIKEELAMNVKVVFHLDWDNGDRLIMVLNNMENLLKEVSAEDAAIHLVANGVAVRLFQIERAKQCLSH